MPWLGQLLDFLEGQYKLVAGQKGLLFHPKTFL